MSNAPDMVGNLEALASWHADTSAECRESDENTIRAFHLMAANTLRRAAKLIDVGNAVTRALADRFAFELRGWLSRREWDEVLARNAREPADSAVCHSHDFCDANMAMDEAFAVVVGRTPDTGSDADAKLWSAAWADAKRRYLTGRKP